MQERLIRQRIYLTVDQFGSIGTEMTSSHLDQSLAEKNVVCLNNRNGKRETFYFIA